MLPHQTSWEHMLDLDVTQWPSVIWKGKLVKVLKAGHALPSTSSVSASRTEVVQEATSFMAECYGEL